MATGVIMTLLALITTIVTVIFWLKSSTAMNLFPSIPKTTKVLVIFPICEPIVLTLKIFSFLSFSPSQVVTKKLKFSQIAS